MKAALRVLIPFHASPDSFQDNVAHTLRAMGHTVLLAPSPLQRGGRIGHMVANSIVRLWPKRWEPHEVFALEAARSFRPDLVLCLTQSLRGEVLGALRESGVRRLVAWWGDPPANMRGMGVLEDGWDQIFIKDRLAAQKLRAVGLNAMLLHEAINPEWHCPQGAARDGSVAVVGNYYGYRQFLVGRLLDAEVELALHGFAPPRWGDPRIRAMHTGRYVARSEKSAVFEGALAGLNCTTMAEGDSLNCRAFEICGAGGLQLIEAKSSVAECFEPDEEVLTYSSVEDILTWLDRARSNAAWAETVRAAGRHRAHTEHTYAHRLTRILEGV